MNIDTLLTALASKITGSAFSDGVVGRVWLDSSLPNPEYPYVLYQVISGSPNDTFAEDLEDVSVQFSIFSTSSSAAEIAAIYNNLETLFDDCVLTISGSVNIWTIRESFGTATYDIEATPTGTATVKQWDVDYSILVQKTA